MSEPTQPALFSLGEMVVLLDEGALSNNYVNPQPAYVQIREIIPSGYCGGGFCYRIAERQGDQDPSLLLGQDWFVKLPAWHYYARYPWTNE